MLSGDSFTETVAVPAKGVPAIKCVDGPNGVRSAATDKDVQSACFPAACCIAATFDPEISQGVGRALAIEARSKRAHCLLGPTICIQRHPLGGRNFETFSEDPWLTGKLAAGYVRGLQELGVSATVKHFVANEQETQRTTVNAAISERALREIYLKPFEIVVREANPWAVMTAYNRVNGTHCDSNDWLLEQVLRSEWAWEGLVMSDWGGTNSVGAALVAGTDLEMPGPPKYRRLELVQEALEKGEITQETIDKRARSVVDFARKLKFLEAAADPAMLGTSTDTPQLRAFIRDTAARGMVLLKNENDILPLTKEKVEGKTIALIGFSKDALNHGGGSAAVNSYYNVTPWDGLHSALGSHAKFTFAAGAHRERLLPPLSKNSSSGSIVDLSGRPGLSRVFFDPQKTDQEPTKVVHEQTSVYSPLGSHDSLWQTLEIVGDFTPSESGRHYLACSSLGPVQLYIDNDMVFEQKGNCRDPMGLLFLAAPEPEIQHPFNAGQTYRIRIRSQPPKDIGLTVLEGRSGARFGFSLQSVRETDLKTEAARVAKEADYAIVFTGHDPQWETEGVDRQSFDLPRGQNELVSAVAKENPNTIVVNSTGSAVGLPWLEDVSGLVQAWFPGQEGGNAIADILTGAINPEGHLAVTFPMAIEDAPAYGNFPGEYVDGRLNVSYAEDVFVGYRHFDRAGKAEPNFSFGFGLSYSTFVFGDMHASLGDCVLEVALDVSNTGKVDGRALVQVYAGAARHSPKHATKTLVGFKKVHLEAGETAAVNLTIELRDLAYFDKERNKWALDKGDYVFSLGDSAMDVLQTITVFLEKMTWKIEHR